MQTLFKKFYVAVALLCSLGATPSQAALLGDLTDGAVHYGSQTGMWSLFLNAGDSIYVQALRLSAFDPIMGLFDGPNGTGSLVAYGDDNIAGNSGIYGGGFSDPAFSYVALISGEYTVQVSQFPGLDQGLGFAYSVQATGSSVPLPGTLALLGLGLFGLGVIRRKQA